eukprot:SAG22_NODE_906_length_6562_cov_11.249884_6_plen_115_part_00
MHIGAHVWLRARVHLRHRERWHECAQREHNQDEAVGGQEGDALLLAELGLQGQTDRQAARKGTVFDTFPVGARQRGSALQRTLFCFSTMAAPSSMQKLMATLMPWSWAAIVILA